MLLSSCNTYFDPVDPYVRGVRFYDRGQYDVSAQLWDPLVEKGDCDAEYWVGMLHFMGQAKPQDNDKAITLWRKAAAGNHPKAQGALGDLHYQSTATAHRCAKCDIQKDLVQAYVWYRLLERSARYDGERRYVKYILAKLEPEMSSDQVAEGARLISQWKPTPKDCGARSLW
ncbi:MAG TPA: hypothetical protein VJV79_08450 [Polyangiaceae bacterium]|nr:hypothetical protein [Polyangiaceae bacterium]